MLKFAFSLSLLILFILPGQAQLNSYKYIIVPKKFDGFKKENQFRTSTQIKHLFTQNGFTAIYDDQYPPDLAQNPCLGLRVLFIDNSSLLATRVKLGLRDCNGVTVYESAEGKSKSKEYEMAFRESINEAFYSFTELGYAYTLSKASAMDDSPAQPEGISPAPKSGETTTSEMTKAVAEVPEAEVAGQQAPRDLEAASKEVIPQNATAAEEGVLAVSAGGIAVGVQGESGEELWYAQPVDNGFQLVDSTPKIRMKLLKTAQKDTFIATVDDAPMGMVYKKDGQWWHEFFKDGKTNIQPLNLKF